MNAADRAGGANAFLDLEYLFLNGAGRIGRGPFTLAAAALIGVLALYERLIPHVAQLLTSWLVDLVLLFCACAVVSKRLHDLGCAGWWTGFGLLAFFNVWPSPQGLGWLFLGLLSAGLLWLGLTPGQRHFNRFGPTAQS